MTQDFAQRSPKGDFNHLWFAIRHIVVDGQYLRPGGCGGSDASKNFGAVAYNDGHIGEGFNAVHGSWLIPQTVLCGEGRALLRHTATPFDKGNLDGFLAAHEANIYAQDVDGTTEIGT